MKLGWPADARRRPLPARRARPGELSQYGCPNQDPRVLAVSGHARLGQTGALPQSSWYRLLGLTSIEQVKFVEIVSQIRSELLMRPLLHKVEASRTVQLTSDHRVVG